ncbi:MAG: branched-chain amino acid ABC transporter permease, partial [Clostridia bacterium]|nr:branched-chain amino acid ABC transporter permease [Clostridia bacterium]
MSYFNDIKRNLKLKNFVIYFIILAVILFSVIFQNAVGFKKSTQYLFESLGYNVIAAVSLSLVVGFLGELSLGHGAFMSLGAFFGVYIRQTLLIELTKSSPLLSLVIAMVVGGLIAAIFGFIIGIPALRLKGDYLAIVTLAFCEIVKVLFENLDIFGGAIGLTNKCRYNSKELFIVGFVTVLLTVIVLTNLIKSKHGRSIMAIRDNEIAARAMGVNVTFYKILVFVISAFFAG